MVKKITGVLAGSVLALTITTNSQAAAINFSNVNNVVDGAGWLWDFTSGGRCATPGAVGVVNGTGDAYDCGVTLAVNGTAHSPAAGDLTGTTVTSSSVISGLNVNRIDFVSSTSAFMRTLFSLTNPTGSTIGASVRYQTNTGADSSQQVISTSSGDTAFTTIDRWLTTDDSSDGGGDPTLNHILFGPGSPGSTLTLADLTVFSEAGDQGVDAGFFTEVLAGDTVSYLFFNQQLSNRAAAASEAALFDDVSALEAAGYLGGLNNSQLSTIVNWDFEVDGRVPEPGTIALFGLGLAGLSFARRKKA